MSFLAWNFNLYIYIKFGKTKFGKSANPNFTWIRKLVSKYFATHGSSTKALETLTETLNEY